MSKVAFGATCTWWDDSTKAKRLVLGQPPVCPHCSGQLRVVVRGRWDAQMEQVLPADRDFISWCQGKCFKHAILAKVAYELERRAQQDGMAHPIY